jgi:hypothetical protein
MSMTCQRPRRSWRRGYTLLVAAKTAPWQQVVTRLLGPEGLLVGLIYTPWIFG